MALERKSAKPAGITDASGQPHIVVEIAGLTISTAPPAKKAARVEAEAAQGPGSVDERSP